MTAHGMGAARLASGGTAVLAAAIALVVGVAGPAWAAPTTTRISQRGAVPANGFSVFAAASLDGRYVTFQSAGTNLGPPDRNGAKDVFLSDRLGNRLELVSVNSDGGQGDADSGRTRPSPVTPDGLHVAFESLASNLVDGDTNGVSDVFLRDRGRFSQTTLISLASDRGPVAGARANGPSFVMAITPDANKVVFLSAATNLVPGDTNGQPDVFVRDRRNRTTMRVSVAQGGGQANGASRTASITADGRYVAFDSVAANLVPGDDNGRSDVFVRDLATFTTTRVSVGCAGTTIPAGCYGSSISADGRYVVYEATPPSGYTQAYAYDRKAGRTILLSVGVDGQPGNGFTFRPAISPTGRYVSFESSATNLVRGVNARMFHAYVRDLCAGLTTLVSVGTTGVPGDAESTYTAPSERGVAFQSRAGNLVPGAVLGDIQIYLRTP
jgi:Tol biopolymer transport system component